MFIGTANISNRALFRSAMLASVAHKWAQAIKYRLSLSINISSLTGLGTDAPTGVSADLAQANIRSIGTDQ